MKKTIIHNVSDLMSLNRDQLDEILLDSTYSNKANLRELIRRYHYSAKAYKSALESKSKEVYRLQEEMMKNGVEDGDDLW